MVVPPNTPTVTGFPARSCLIGRVRRISHASFPSFTYLSLLSSPSFLPFVHHYPSIPQRLSENRLLWLHILLIIFLFLCGVIRRTRLHD
ncbi:hypothetical protein AFLA_006929 [Aspergillus flavus NRRL3357]|nr:hypothetical protein AFLA_006929 [Aspergillus flavus NRRL3357]